MGFKVNSSCELLVAKTTLVRVTRGSPTYLVIFAIKTNYQVGMKMRKKNGEVLNPRKMLF